jgi:hypothetical protein
MSGAEIMAVVGFFVTLVGAVASVWFRIEGKVKQAADKADAVATALAEHKLHTSEHYVSKTGLREMRDEILGAMVSIKEDLRHITLRIDASNDAHPRSRTRSSG